MFIVAAVLMIVLLAVIGDMIDQGSKPDECQPHKWVTNVDEKRNHYLICAVCKKEPLQ